MPKGSGDVDTISRAPKDGGRGDERTLENTRIRNYDSGGSSGSGSSSSSVVAVTPIRRPYARGGFCDPSPLVVAT